MIIRDKGSRRLAAATVLLLLMAAMDFVLPSGSWYASHPMTSAAIVTLLSFLVAGLLLDSWIKEREASRLRPISTVAYRSLAQVANDAGRSLMATLNGADLWLLGVPGHSASGVADAQRRIGRVAGITEFAETGGTWARVDPRDLDDLLGGLLHDEEYVRDLFRLVAVQRRRVQAATADWAPVMLTASALADDLGEFRRLADALEMLQESIRACGTIGCTGPFAPDLTWNRSVRGHFWAAVDAYEQLRDEFAERAELPSDEITSRRSTLASNGVPPRRVQVELANTGSFASPGSSGQALADRP